MIIVLDDVGFGQLGCYGSAIATPRIDALAAQGVRYTNFHVGTYAARKWHLAPPGQLGRAVRPVAHRPRLRPVLGFLGGEDDQFAPELWQDRQHVEPSGAPGYHLSDDLADRAMGYVGDHLSATLDRPFFLYLAFGACHAPHQAPRAFIDAYRGAFDDGWDVERARQLGRQLAAGLVPSGTTLAPRNPDVPAWDDLAPEEQRVCARLQEAFAGFMTHTDAQVGRLLEFLVGTGIADDTLVVLLSDNGASGEGGRLGSLNEYRYFLGLPDVVADTIAGLDHIGGPPRTTTTRQGGPRPETARVNSEADVRRRCPGAVDHQLAGAYCDRREPAAVPPCRGHRGNHLGGHRHQGPRDGARWPSCRCMGCR